MASTRNKNMPGEYCLRQMSNKHSTNFMTYEGAGLNTNNFLPCAGILHGKFLVTFYHKILLMLKAFF